MEVLNSETIMRLSVPDTKFNDIAKPNNFHNASVPNISLTNSEEDLTAALDDIGEEYEEEDVGHGDDIILHEACEDEDDLPEMLASIFYDNR